MNLTSTHSVNRKSRGGLLLAILTCVAATTQSPLDAAERFKSTKLPIDGSKVVTPLCWSKDAKRLYVLRNDGVLRVLDVPDFAESKRVDLKAHCSGFGLSQSGPVVLLDVNQELVVLDHDLKELHRLKRPGITHLATATSLPFAYIMGKNSITTLDVVKGRVKAAVNTRTLLRRAARVKRTERRAAPLDFRLATCSPDGKYLLTMADYRINRFAIRRTGGLTWEESGWKIGSGGTPIRLNVTGTPAMVAMPCGAGNREVPGHPPGGYGTYVYDMKSLRVPKTKIQCGAYPTAVAYDSKAKLLYAQGSEKEVIVLNFGGVKLAQYNLGGEYARTAFLLPHPTGRKVIVGTQKAVFWCEVPDKLKP